MEDKKAFLGTAPVGKLLFRLALPTVVAQLINMLYNVVDRIYIGHIAGTGDLALTGLGLCFPIIMVITAFSSLIGGGGAPRVAIAMGRLVKKALSVECWGPNKPNVLVIAPPPIGEGMLTSAVAATMGEKCVETSRELAHYYKEQCDLIGCHFLDAQELGAEFNTVDFMHLTKKGHANMAEGLAKRIPELVK